jgi:hypothetical protein
MTRYHTEVVSITDLICFNSGGNVSSISFYVIRNINSIFDIFTVLSDNYQLLTLNPILSQDIMNTTVLFLCKHGILMSDNLRITKLCSQISP